ncbi:gallinacin-12-like [Cyrtonyx montezumae]|uniref:gallinacin-12-like n=1 Tax=Cyrtonyx montezumae TaxID=9017 RepID=UPI0032DAC143
MPTRLPTPCRGFCTISRSALLLPSRSKVMGSLCFVFIFISLLAHGSTHGPGSCNHGRGLCRMGNCIPGEYLAKYCFKPVILCCKPLSPTSTKS